LTMDRITDGPSNTIFFTEGFANCGNVVQDYNNWTGWQAVWNPATQTDSWFTGTNTNSWNYGNSRGGLAFSIFGGENSNVYTARAPGIEVTNNNVYTYPAYGTTFSGPYFEKQANNNINTVINAFYPNSWQTPVYQVATTVDACNYQQPQSIYSSGLQIALGDGSVRTVASGISAGTWYHACTPTSNDVLGSDW
jgi:hypothetical protein